MDGVRELLGVGRKDESGDFTKGAGLEKEQIDKIVVFALLQEGHLTELEDVTNLSPSARAESGTVMTFSPRKALRTSLFLLRAIGGS